MTSSIENRTIALTIILKPDEYETAIDIGFSYLRQLGEYGLFKEGMKRPDTEETRRGVAILGVQELIASRVRPICKGDCEDRLDDEIPF